jgi:hypothetical protein
MKSRPSRNSRIVHQARIDVTNAEQRLAFAMHAAVSSEQSVEFWLDKLEAIVAPLQVQLLLNEAGK